MAALDYDITIEQGARYRLAVPVFDPEGAALDVTGWSLRGQIRLSHNSPDPVYSLTGVLSTSGSTVLLDIPGDDSVTWMWREGVYDVELIDPDAHTTRLLQGRVLVSPETTR